MKGALVKGPEVHQGGLLSWGSSLVSGSNAGTQDWAIMRGLALCGDGAGPQACYSIHHNAAPGLGLHAQGEMPLPCCCVVKDPQMLVCWEHLVTSSPRLYSWPAKGHLLLRRHLMTKSTCIDTARTECLDAARASAPCSSIWSLHTKL